MKRFLTRLAFICIPFFLLLFVPFYLDTFNVFHWRSRRFTTATPNENFIKTKYILRNPKKFNAFIFGSSRAGNLPADALPKDLNGKTLYWYNMTYSLGIPSEHYLSLKTFLENGVGIDFVIVEFDELSMYVSIEQHKNDLLRIPYQVYEESPQKFFSPYLQIQNVMDMSILKQVIAYKKNSHTDDTKLFYGYGGWKGDFSLTASPNLEGYEARPIYYTQKEAHKDIEDIVKLCDENKIKLVLLTSPTYQTTYRKSIDAGYFDFLKKVAKQCEFYNFSALNNFTRNPQYYYESSHFRPALGLLVEKILFGTEEERSRIRQDANDEAWGINVNAENIDSIILNLKKQIHIYE